MLTSRLRLLRLTSTGAELEGVSNTLSIGRGEILTRAATNAADAIVVRVEGPLFRMRER